VPFAIQFPPNHVTPTWAQLVVVDLVGVILCNPTWIRVMQSALCNPTWSTWHFPVLKGILYGLRVRSVHP